MSSQALEGASRYLNNLLLARGLLQDANPIAFADPAGESGASDATMSRIINLIHDLVLRRDRDAEHRETLAVSIRNLKAEEVQHATDLQKLQSQNSSLKDDLASAEARQRTFDLAAKKAEKQAKELREQMLKMKSTLDQVRAKCVSDVRKRDVEIEKLKSHLGSMQRGRKDVGGMRIHVLNPRQATVAGTGREQAREGVDGSHWGLDNETNDLLAALVDETSTENVALRRIVYDTSSYLKSLTEMAEERIVPQDGIGIPGQYRQSRQPDAIVPVQQLAAEMSRILEHCSTILKDPSFVPIEEVHARDAEIQKLRAGWEKMADRWKEAVTMMSQWRQKMAVSQADQTGQFETEGLSGLGVFGRSVALRPDGQPVLGAIEEEELSSILFDQGKTDDDDSTAQLMEGLPSEPEEEGTPVRAPSGSPDEESDLDLSEERPSKQRIAASPAKRGIRLPRPVVKPLSETNGNVKRPSITKKARSATMAANTENFYDEDEDEAELATENEPPWTVAQKLAAIEVEASEATMDLRRRQATQKRKPVDRDRKMRKSSRRRSTLSPEELAQLMGS